jgi:hypothetical protein
MALVVVSTTWMTGQAILRSVSTAIPILTWLRISTASGAGGRYIRELRPKGSPHIGTILLKPQSLPEFIISWIKAPPFSTFFLEPVQLAYNKLGGVDLTIPTFGHACCGMHAGAHRSA